jgi:hypothetical protein
MIGLLFWLLAAGASPPQVQCELIPGVETLSAQPELRWIIAGEQHGTQESPKVFGDLVCALSKTRKVVVGLEFATTAQPDLDRYIRSDGGPEAVKAFLASEIWTDEFKDGRSSEAMFELVDSLRQLSAAGKIERVVAFKPVTRAKAGEYEVRMTNNLRKAAGRDETVIALVGNIHALRTHWAAVGIPYMPMAGLLPGSATATISIYPDGGSQWACVKECGPNSLGPSRGLGGRRLVFGKAPDRAYSAVLFTGGAATASPPKRN